MVSSGNVFLEEQHKIQWSVRIFLLTSICWSFKLWENNRKVNHQNRSTILKTNWSSFVDLFVCCLENKCEYHQHQTYNASETADKTRVGKLLSFVFYFRAKTDRWKSFFCRRWFVWLGMVRTMYAFSVIHILLAIVTLVCGLYSLHDHRYTYKRLTAMIYILTGKIEKKTKEEKRV